MSDQKDKKNRDALETRSWTSLEKRISEGLTFDDVVLEPSASEILPRHAELRTFFTRNIPLKTPLVSAAMDTVTESRTAIVMAQEGGMGVVHKNMKIEDQVLEVKRVKKSESGMILDPITISPNAPISEALDMMSTYKISGVPVTEDRKLVGILTNRDLRFEKDFGKKVKSCMTGNDQNQLVTVPEGTTLAEAQTLLQKHKIEKLPVVDKNFELLGLITIKDIEKSIAFPDANKDDYGRLRVAAAVGTGADGLERASALIQAGADALVVDTAHGHSHFVGETVRAIKKAHDIQVVAGNIVTAEAAKALINAGVDAIKVGVGPGSICTTRVVAGVGMPQLSAINRCAEVSRDAGVPLIADGGIRYSGDLVKAFAAGADCCMIGSLFAGTDESPGEFIHYQGRAFKVYRGMGSLDALKAGSKDRYFQSDVDEALKLVPEGIEGRVPYRGSLSSNVHQLLGGLRSGMGYLGAKTLEKLRTEAKFVRVTLAGKAESHPHDIMITKEAPNYRLGQ
jgi:IMP dehydrogenase